MDIVYFLFKQTLLFAIPLMIVAIGGMFSERGGVVNIALEGIMIMSAFVGIYYVHNVQLTGGGQSQGTLLIALIIAGIVGIVFSCLHAFASIHVKADQTISGTALNLLAPALGLFIAKMQQNGIQFISFKNYYRIKEVPGLASIPVIGDLFFKDAYISTFIGIAILVISGYVLYRTRFGLRLRACGENPQAADAAGVNVYFYRYAGVLISGLLAGMGGLIYIIPISTEYNCNVAGYGFLAMAVLIFGNWNPKRIGIAALFFGAMKTLAYAYSSIPFLSGLGLPTVIFKLAPYIATLVLLTFTSKNSAAPRAAGEPYDKAKR